MIVAHAAHAGGLVASEAALLLGLATLAGAAAGGLAGRRRRQVLTGGALCLVGLVVVDVLPSLLHVATRGRPAVVLVGAVVVALLLRLLRRAGATGLVVHRLVDLTAVSAAVAAGSPLAAVLAVVGHGAAEGAALRLHLTVDRVPAPAARLAIAAFAALPALALLVHPPALPADARALALLLVGATLLRAAATLLRLGAASGHRRGTPDRARAGRAAHSAPIPVERQHVPA